MSGFIKMGRDKAQRGKKNEKAKKVMLEKNKTKSAAKRKGDLVDNEQNKSKQKKMRNIAENLETVRIEVNENNEANTGEDIFEITVEGQ